MASVRVRREVTVQRRDERREAKRVTVERKAARRVKYGV